MQLKKIKLKTITQDYSAITIDGKKDEISVTELKNTVLELLNYPKEFSKKQNILYKFTVYTPQEEMKQIILQDSETRINTLRHVFGIDKYKQILENTSIIMTNIREEKRVREGITMSLEQDKTNVIKKEQKEKLNNHQLEINSKINSINYKNQDHKNLIQTMSNLKNCPTCLQNVDAIYRANVLNKANSDIVENNKKIEFLEQEKKEILKQNKILEEEIHFKERKITDLKILKMKLQDIDKKEKKLHEIEISKNSLNQDLIILKKHLETLNNSIFELAKYDGKFNAKQIELQDDFTPIIEQQDYEIDYAFLSGGERTAIALAYRLSLNQVINSLLSKIKTKDLVILDEPTDGFSEQQLDKMRDVLQQLKIGQLIIVSHEQKIESFVENVIRFKKDHGISIRE